MSNQEFRVEYDLLGERQVPQEAYYGVHTLRAKENFDISGTTVSSALSRCQGGCVESGNE